MMDFLKQNPHVSKEEYMWEWTIPQILLGSYDSTRVEYLDEEEYEDFKKKKNVKKYDDVSKFVNDLNIPIFK